MIFQNCLFPEVTFKTESKLQRTLCPFVTAFMEGFANTIYKIIINKDVYA